MGILLDDAVSISTSNSYRYNCIIGDTIFKVNSGIREAATRGFSKFFIRIAQTVNEIPSDKFKSFNEYWYLHHANTKMNKFKNEIVQYYKNEGFDVNTQYRNVIEISWQKQVEDHNRKKENK